MRPDAAPNVPNNALGAGSLPKDNVNEFPPHMNDYIIRMSLEACHTCYQPLLLVVLGVILIYVATRTFNASSASSSSAS
jgi:hypothetical protein